MWVGFARVSNKEQDLNNRLEALQKAGCERIFHGKQSGSSKENDRRLAELVDYVRDGDVVVVAKLDRLGRSLKMILQTLEDIHRKGAMLKTLDGSIDTSQETPSSKAMVSLIGTFAELERNLIVSRTSEGREAAKSKGVKFGRKPSMSEEEQLGALSKLRTGQSVRATAKEFGVTRQTLYRVLERFRLEEL